MVIGACTWLGVAMTIAWTSSRLTMSSQLVLVVLIPVAWLALASVSGLLSQSATTFVSGHRAKPGRWLANAMPPLPMIATPMVLTGRFLLLAWWTGRYCSGRDGKGNASGP